MQKISFTANCQACHALQFDASNSELILPHGDPIAVRLFLQTLPSQYEVLAVKKGITNRKQARAFAATQMAQLRRSLGEDFEQIFFKSKPSQPQPEQTPPTGSSFQGCAFCHEVNPSATGPPVVTKPVLIDRWMPHAQFNHAKHTRDSTSDSRCIECHDAAAASQETSDVLMPAKGKCVDCHSPAAVPEKKTGSECITCHSYHASPPAATVAQSGAGATISFKHMLLGR